MPAAPSKMILATYHERSSIRGLRRVFGVSRDRGTAWLKKPVDCRRSRQVVASAIGDRGQRTLQLLWERIPAADKIGLVFTDFWDAYQKVVPQEQHRAMGKGDEETNHITPIKS